MRMSTKMPSPMITARMATVTKIVIKMSASTGKMPFTSVNIVLRIL